MSRNSFATHAMYSIIGFAITGGSRFLYSVLVGRALGAGILASVTAALAVTVLFSLVWPAGLAAAATHHVSTNRSLGQAFDRVLRVVELSFLASIFAIMIVTGMYAGSAFSEGLVFVLSVVVLAGSYSGYILARSLQLAIDQTRQAVLWEGVCAVISLGGLALVMVTGATSAVLWPMAIAFVVYMVQAQVSLRRQSRVGVPHELSVARELSASSAWNSVSLLASNGLIQFAMLMVFAALTREQAGIFAAAITLATPASMLAQALSQVLLPRSSAWRVTEVDSGRHIFGRIFSATVAGFVFLFGILIFISPWIVQVIYGASFLPAVFPLQVLLAGMAAFSIGVIATANLLAARRERVVTVASLISLGTGLAGIVLAAGIFGWTAGAAIGVAVGYIVGGLLLSVQSFRVFRAQP